MTTRIIAVIAAAVLAIVGAVLLVTYVRGADERAFNGTKLTEVLVVQNEIAAGTNGGALGTSVSLKSIPISYVAEGAVTDVAALDGLVAAVVLEPGEQVLASRFVKPDSFGSSGGRAPIPEGLQEISLAIDQQRIVGGSLRAGDTVGVLVSLTGEGDAPSSTRLIENGVLVTSVGSTQDPASTQVSLAVTADQAQRIVYALEFGRVWLSNQPAGTTAVQGGPVTRGAFPG